MGNCVSLSVSSDGSMERVCKWLDVKVGYVHNLGKNLAALETTMEELKAKRDDLSRRVTREEDRGLQRLSEFQVWLTRVETFENEVNGLVSARDAQLQRLCLCGFCSNSLISSYRYGENIYLALKEVEKLKSRVFEVIAEQARACDEVEEKQLQPTIVGQREMLEKAWNHLMEDGVGFMGMHGMGGVGKTTLLTQLNNKFCDKRCGFDFVVWVVVSRELHVEKIQDEIARKVLLGLGGGEEWKQKEKSEKADVIYNFLRRKRFVLFLDDIWEKVDLVEIGIPFPTRQNRCKVAFTTRSKAVCAHMGVEEPMEVKCLAESDAFDLFEKKVGKTTLGSDPEIPKLARRVAKKCCGLPLALNVIGETMSCKRTVQEWYHAIDVLTSYAIEFCCMKDKILPLLKFSYDNLKGEETKSCLLYCALFPEDERIPKEKLINLWICEGIIDGNEGIERAENKGYEIICSLVRASLLTEVKWHGTDYVCMHDVVREMALWIASDVGTQKEAIVVSAGAVFPKVEDWNVVRRMSLIKSKIHHLVGNPECLELTTLLLQKANLANISSEFFKSMPRLVVLDLSYNGDLFELPEGISQLVSLQYLNLSNTSIRNLPMGVQELKKLIHLDLEDTDKLSNIVGISSLHSLRTLNISRVGFSLDLDVLEELETLEHLEVLTIDIDLPPSLEQFLSSHRLTSCTRNLTIRGMHLKSSGISLPVTMDKLRELNILWCSISEINMAKICIESKIVSPLHNPRNTCCFLSLSKVIIIDCKGLKELTLLMFAPNLRTLSVESSNHLEDIINKDKGHEGENSEIIPFPKLVYLTLARLPELKSIYWRSLRFPCLKRIDVIECPNLKKLPLDSQSGENGLFIRYTAEEWIESVEWEDEATKTRLLPSCLQV